MQDLTQQYILGRPYPVGRQVDSVVPRTAGHGSATVLDRPLHTDLVARHRHTRGARRSDDQVDIGCCSLHELQRPHIRVRVAGGGGTGVRCARVVVARCPGQIARRGGGSVGCINHGTRVGQPVVAPCGVSVLRIHRQVSIAAGRIRQRTVIQPNARPDVAVADRRVR